MRHHLLLLLAATAAIASVAAYAQSAAPSTPIAPTYTGDKLQLPENYREWVYLTSGFDMSYNPAMRMGHHMFDNVFVDPAAYRAFVNTGTWPDKTMLLIEARRAEDKGSINKSGQFQGTDIMGIEVHVKDEARFPGKWAFFGFNDDTDKLASKVDTSADCYSCHKDHAAVDTTFVQFYPTLLSVANAKGTWSAAYLAQEAAAAAKPASASARAPANKP